MRLHIRNGAHVVRFSVLVWIILSSALVPAGAVVPTAHAATQATPGQDANFYKLTVTQTGMQAVTYDALAAAGLPVATLNASTIQIYEQGVEIARRIVDADSSHTFNSGDYVLFYGRAVDTAFTATNIYWLTYGAGTGLDMATRNAAPQSGLPSATSFQETLHFEQNYQWLSDAPIVGEADRWYWQILKPSCGRGGVCKPGVLTFPITLPGVASGVHTATITPRLRGYSVRMHEADVFINGQPVGVATYDQEDEFTGNFDFSQNVLVAGSNTMTITAPVDSDPTQDLTLVNWFDIRYWRTFDAPAAGQFPFGVDASTPVSVTLTNIQDGGSSIYDITDPRHPVLLTGVQTTASAAALQSIDAFTLKFAHKLSAPAKYIAAGPTQYLNPTSITPDQPSQLHNPAQGADWIIISHANFLSAAQTLANYRHTADGYRTAVVDVQDIYDEFNGGLMDQEAIRSFIRYAYEQWPRPAPRFVVLLGDGHYDPRDFLNMGIPDLIPPYLAAVDPFEGVTAADNRYVSYDPVPGTNNPMPFMSLGRLPANTLADAQAMVDKTIAYETTPLHSTWNKNDVFVADDPDFAGNFPESSDLVADSTTLLPPDFARQKIYFKTPEYTTVLSTTTAIVDAINAGALFVSYHGHSSRQAWAGERIWDVDTINGLNNTGKYPIMLPMTCLEGYYINPEPTQQSLGESIVRMPSAGAVASWSPTGKGVATGHEVIYQAFYEAVFEKGISELGVATDYAKKKLYDSSSIFKDLIDTYVLFGDPALTIDLPAADVWLQKSATPGPWQPNQSITYTLRFGNIGILPASGVVITDLLPSGIVTPTWISNKAGVNALPGFTYVWQLPDLAPGASGVITVSARVASGLPTGTTITNTAMISTTAREPRDRWANNTGTIADAIQGNTGTLGGHTYVDTNANGVYDPGSESPVANVPVTIRNNKGAVVTVVQSNNQGIWSADLPGGVYTATVTSSFGTYELHTSPSVSRTLAVGASISNIDFGYLLPTGLGIEYFRAAWSVGGVNLEWLTLIETDLTGFNVYRSSNPLEHGKQINTDFIEGTAPPDQGAKYTFADSQAAPGNRVYYWLQVNSNSMQPFWLGPVAPTWIGRAYLPYLSR